MLVCGVDDAGRGSLLGPLIIAGVTMQRSDVRKLSALGVKDSKKLSPKQREYLYDKIIRLATEYTTAKISPRTIDKSVLKHDLNNLEARYMAKVITRLSSPTSYVDSCDVDPKRFGQKLSTITNKTIRSYHHADSRFLIVAAASIVAKVTRDKAIKRLQKDYPVGSGYPSDKRTIAFVRNYFHANSNLPKFVRSSWRPVQQIIKESGMKP